MQLHRALGADTNQPPMRTSALQLSLLAVIVQFAGALLSCRTLRTARASRLHCTAAGAAITAPEGDGLANLWNADNQPKIIPHGRLQLPPSPHISSSCPSTATFSILSWNCLLPNSEDNWWCEKMYQASTPTEARKWPHRQRLIRERIMLADADIVCIQEAAGDTFDSDFAFMAAHGYESVLHKKFRFRCATFYRPSAFTLQSVAHEDRALLTSFLRPGSTPAEERTLYVANCHLSGGASPDRRLRQIHGATERVRKWVAAAKPKTVLKGRRGSAARRAQNASLGATAGGEMPPPPPPPPRVIIAGDFNSDGNTAVRRLLTSGVVEPEWREPQYSDVPLTSKPRKHALGDFVDAGEHAYAQNVCDGDWGDWGARTCYDRYRGRRPATYVVPSLASVFLQRTPTSTFRQQVVADNEMLERLRQRREEPPSPPPTPVIPRRGEDSGASTLSASDLALCDSAAGDEGVAFVEACRRVFDAIDADLGGSISATELRDALERLAVVGDAGEAASDADADAMLSAADTDDNGEIDFAEFVAIVRSGGGVGGGSSWWARFLRSLRGGEGGEGGGGGEVTQSAELVRLETEADVDALIARFTPGFRAALDSLFDRLAAGESDLSASDEVRISGEMRTSDEGYASEEVLSASDEIVISEAVAVGWLQLVNRELGRGGTYRGVMAALDEREASGGGRVLSRRAWHGVFARELGEGKWWQVAYDLDVSGVSVDDFEADAAYNYGGGVGGDGASKAPPDGRRKQHGPRPSARVPRRHYEAWLDYVYYTHGGLKLAGYQESVNEEQARRIYQEGDALPNAWFPSDHLPVGCIFEWEQ